MMLRIGTRASQLALCQAHWVKGQLENRFQGLEVVLEKIKTIGDKILDVPLAKVGGKGLFVKEIEEALLRKTVDLAVHSMKDVPAVLPEELHLSATVLREDPHDVLISREDCRLEDLPKGARIGTSSLRRQSQLLSFRSDFRIIQLRGNLDTRLRKLEQEGLDGIILAAAGLKRMGWWDRVSQVIDFEISLPAVGQGALGLECRIDDEQTNRMLNALNHEETQSCVRAERALLKRLEGGCQVPIGAYAQIDGESLLIEGMVASLDGTRLIREQERGPIQDAEILGIRLAENLLSCGANTILKEIYSRPV